MKAASRTASASLTAAAKSAGATSDWSMLAVGPNAWRSCASTVSSFSLTILISEEMSVWLTGEGEIRPP